MTQTRTSHRVGVQDSFAGSHLKGWGRETPLAQQSIMKEGRRSLQTPACFAAATALGTETSLSTSLLLPKHSVRVKYHKLLLGHLPLAVTRSLGAQGGTTT